MLSPARMLGDARDRDFETSPGRIDSPGAVLAGDISSANRSLGKGGRPQPVNEIRPNSAND